MTFDLSVSICGEFYAMSVYDFKESSASRTRTASCAKNKKLHPQQRQTHTAGELALLQRAAPGTSPTVGVVRSTLHCFYSEVCSICYTSVNYGTNQFLHGPTQVQFYVVATVRTSIRLRFTVRCRSNTTHLRMKMCAQFDLQDRDSTRFPGLSHCSVQFFFLVLDDQSTSILLLLLDLSQPLFRACNPATPKPVTALTFSTNIHYSFNNYQCDTILQITTTTLFHVLKVQLAQ